MKLTVIGGGGVRSMFLAKSLARKATALGITELCFMDNNPVKLSIYGEMARKVASIIDPSLKFSLTADAVTAVKDADYVITTIRVGEDDMRVKDERIALEHGVIGQETTGVAGFSFAMRSIPALIDYCELIKKHSKPNVKVFNFTNPAGIVSQALRAAGYDFTFGICDAPSGMLTQFKKIYGHETSTIEGEISGLNHCSFFTSIKLDGDEIIPKIISDPRAYVDTDIRYFDKELLLEKGYVPNEYLYYYFYADKALKNISSSVETRGELIARVNRNMTEELSKINVNSDFEKALEIYEKWYGVRDGSYMANETGIKRNNEWKFDICGGGDDGYAGVAIRYIEIINENKVDNMVLCVPNGDAIPYLDKDDVVEVTATVSKDGVVPHKFEALGEYEVDLLKRVKEYERLGALSILKRDKALALKALAVHPLMVVKGAENSILESYIEHNKEYCEGWK
ncbi:MAG: 6-phospho-beta-glucosidase [Clostridia bacterium]|nr:6-phospho-beta-glucosidase [Clostridia bacterium]